MNRLRFHTTAIILSTALFSGCALGDGVSWSGNLLPSGAPLVRDVAYGNERFVAVTSGGAAYVPDNGFSWAGPVLVPGAGGVNLMKIIFGEGRFVAVGNNGIIVYSEDGYIWSGNMGPGGTSSFQCIAFRP